MVFIFDQRYLQYGRTQTIQLQCQTLNVKVGKFYGFYFYELLIHQLCQLGSLNEFQGAKFQKYHSYVTAPWPRLINTSQSFNVLHS